VCYLAITETGEETRDRLVGLLWSETEEERARASLRQSLYEIREAFDAAGYDGLTSDRFRIGLDRSRIDVDLWNILDDAIAGIPHPILLQSERPIEKLLDEFETLDGAFQVWLAAKRQAIGDRLTRQFELLLRNDTKPLSDREAIARALLNLDPTHEEAVRLLIRARVEAGDIGAALRIYKTLWDLLDSDYDVEPSKETQELIAAIKLDQPLNGRVGLHGAMGIASLPPPGQFVDVPRAVQAIPLHQAPPPKLIVSIAAFDTRPTSETDRYLILGFRRELIACLVRFREWIVRDTTFAPSKEPAADAGEYAIEAAAFGTGESLRLVITLRDCGTNSYLWSERLNVSIDNWFVAQQRIVRHVTTALNVHLSVGRLSTITDRPPANLEAYDLWLVGQATFLSFDARSWEMARHIFRQVIEKMPDFAPAYSSLAQLNNSDHIVRPGVLRDATRSAQSLMYAREAARLDPIDSRSQLCLGWSHAMAKQYEQALIFISLAYELNENDPWTLVSSAGCFAVCGEYDRANEIAQHALNLPLAPSPLQWAYHVSIRFMAGDYAGAVEAANAAGDLSYVPAYKASALYHLGDRAGAAAELRRFIEITRKRWVGTDPPTDANIIRWLLTMVPIRRQEDWERVRDGLAGAGAPVEGLAHHQW
jgi:DNA-binding SARP family transcriptional activator/TolB-like protein